MKPNTSHPLLLLLVASLFPCTALVCSTVCFLHDLPFVASFFLALTVLTLPRFRP